MKKIMFNDRYGLTQAVLDGRKTQTRRIIASKIIDKVEVFGNHYYINTLTNLDGKGLLEHYFFTEEIGKLPYKVGEIVAVAQSYGDCGNFPDDMKYDEDGWPIMPHRSGYFNKMFVKASLMPSRIVIKHIWVEKLQDISDEDCIREGVQYIRSVDKYYFEDVKREAGFYIRTPREAFAVLMDKVCGKGTWDSNPYVFVYEFELVTPSDT